MILGSWHGEMYCLVVLPQTCHACGAVSTNLANHGLYHFLGLLGLLHIIITHNCCSIRYLCLHRLTLFSSSFMIDSLVATAAAATVKSFVTKLAFKFFLLLRRLSVVIVLNYTFLLYNLLQIIFKRLFFNFRFCILSRGALAAILL